MDKNIIEQPVVASLEKPIEQVVEPIEKNVTEVEITKTAISDNAVISPIKTREQPTDSVESSIVTNQISRNNETKNINSDAVAEAIFECIEGGCDDKNLCKLSEVVLGSK